MSPHNLLAEIHYIVFLVYGETLHSLFAVVKPCQSGSHLESSVGTRRDFGSINEVSNKAKLCSARPGEAAPLKLKGYSADRYAFVSSPGSGRPAIRHTARQISKSPWPQG